MTATCDCKFNDIANSNIIKDNAILDSAFGEILDLINSSNILVFKCFKNMFTHFSRSIGGWISLVLICAHIGMTLVFFLISSPQVNKYLFSLTYNYLSFIKNSPKIEPSLPPKKNLINSKKSDKFVASINSQENLKFKKSKLNPAIIPKTPKEEIVVQYEEGNIKISDVNMDTIDNIKETEKTAVKDEQKFSKTFFIEYMSTSLDDLEFDDAVAKDHRKYCEHMAENLKEDQMIANTFIAEDPIKPRTIKVILLILNFILYFVVNGLFFSEEVISELYNVNEDDENFFSFFPRSIERIIYSTIVSIIIGMITDFFFIDEKKIKGIFRREKII